MSTLQAAVPTQSKPAVVAKRFSLDYTMFLVSVVILSAVYVGYRMYQQAHGPIQRSKARG